MIANHIVLPDWDEITDSNRKMLALQLAKQLPAGFQFTGIETFEVAEQRHHVAHYNFEGAVFSLIPGGKQTLGYDPNQSFRPAPYQLASWQTAAAEFAIQISITDYMRDVLCPPRTVNLAPFLMEVTSQDKGVGPVDSATGLRRETWYTHAEAQEIMAQQGFRLATADEWEYACAAGSHMLFRWGDDYPPDCSPTSCPTWQLHRAPNAFGLHTAYDPYDWEFVDEPGIMRGGDGGGMACGGAGLFAEWLTLASAFRGHTGSSFPTHTRHRVYPLIHSMELMALTPPA